MIYFDDVQLGVKTDLGSHTFTADEIIEFARQWDPQPFHTDPDAAKASVFGGLVASGWHICAIWMRLMVQSRLNAGRAKEDRIAAGVSPGFLDLRWLHPVRPGDEVAYSTTTMEKVPLKSRPQFGILRSLNEGVNQDGIKVMTFIGQGYMPRRPSR